MPSFDDLKLATSSRCVPYMDENLSDEDMRRYMMSFVNDKRIPSDTLFNIFQMTLKLFNTGGGTSPLGLWNHPSDSAPILEHAPTVLFNNQDMVCIAYWSG